MRFCVMVEQRQVGFVEADIPDDEWERHPHQNVRKKLIKRAAVEAMAQGADIAWEEPFEVEATTSGWRIDMGN